MDAAPTEEHGFDPMEREKSGSTVIFLSYDGLVRGVFVVSDQVRKEAAEAVGKLKTAGLGVAMVTGDNVNVAEAVAKKTGIEFVKAQTSPMEKVAEISRLKKEGRHVLMAGDGINDAPALVEATVGIAVGRATDIALESADIVVMRSDLRLIADAMTLTKKTFRIIRQNIFWAFFYNIVAIPLAILGMLHPIMAAGAMAFSSLSVVGNSMRARLR
jgi:P-type E1-E2 ATPase